MKKGKTTKSGVFVSDDFRDNLILDRYDNVFSRMRGDKITYMQSENSEDVLTWNVFRTLSKINPTIWLPLLFKIGCGADISYLFKYLTIELWPVVEPPTGIRHRQKDEGESEIDIRIESEDFVWFIEAKYKSDISTRTTNNKNRDQILRNIDVGSWYAGRRPFHFTLLILDDSKSPLGVQKVDLYRQEMFDFKKLLPHRKDDLGNIQSVDLMKWADILDILRQCLGKCQKDDERFLLEQAIQWMEDKGI